LAFLTNEKPCDPNDPHTGLAVRCRGTKLDTGEQSQVNSLSIVAA
jgi:hypothetical protein